MGTTPAKRRAPLALGALALALALGGCGITAPPTAAPTGGTTASHVGTAATAPTAAGESGTVRALETTYENVIRKVLPSIVQINAENGLGSGIVYDTSGHIITNAHVLGDARTFQVTLPSGGTPRAATLVATHPLGDLAIIKVKDATGLAPVRFGDSRNARVGQIVLAMGNPLGLSGSVTNGIISALGRTVTEPVGRGSTGATIANAIQTSAAINPGNSGGALVTMNAEVIGIPTLAAADPTLGRGTAPGIGFAIPSNTAVDIANQIIKEGKVTNTRRAALGISGQTVVSQDGTAAGVGVVRVSPNSGAERAGILPGDIIVGVNGTKITTMADLSELLATLSVGREAKVDIRHPDGSQESVNIKLGELPGQ
ncbi:putative serine protease PepD [Sinosporangium album]|uniref:Putative serine protease PepD n=1 Tax=Sinosporangium album TaxID=504805 RepID=A0A1G7VUP4_9ACTN|nr:trypsin-like peptidase domain-containing protein [Sinosporangium album]SDG63397.1 putative serine protease PepD [Sinosporangium album]